MNQFHRRLSLIVLVDLLIALFAFWVSRCYEGLNGWYWIVLSAFVWVALGLITNKLFFSKYKRLRYVFAGLLLVDSLVGAVIFFLYREFITDYQDDYSVVIATGVIFAMECVLYGAIRKFVYNKIPYFYEEPSIDESIEPIKHIEVDESLEDEYILRVVKQINESEEDPIESIIENLPPMGVVVDSSEPEAVFQSDVRTPSLIVHRMTLNCVRHINTLLAFTNYKLCDDGYVLCRCVTSGIRKERIMKQMPRPLNRVIYLLDYLNHRVMPKLPFLKRIYYAVTKGERRALTRVEVLGRIYRAGFEVVSERVVDGKFYLLAKRIQSPIRHDKPSNGLLIRLKRNGRGGKRIGVYKFRTMHAYSEYLQPYMYKTEGLAKDGGRYGNDYRINKTGAFMRKFFIDELPMLVNWVKGDLKLVGVRPLSNHYFGLYTKDFQELRLKVKPGLIPPFYVDKPKSIEEKQESERRYIESYLKHPFLTDWSYFWRIFNSIVFKGTRSE